MANITEMQTFGDLQHLVVDADPSTSAGTPGVVSSLAFVTGLGKVFIKTGALDTAWSEIPNLSTDLTGYLKLLGRAGGQSAFGGTAAGENLTFSSTSNATKGKILYGSIAAIDEANTRFGLGTITPATTMEFVKNSNTYQVEFATTSTSNATVTNVGSIATTTGDSGTIRITVTAKDSSNNTAAWARVTKFKNVAGTLTITTPIQSVETQKDSALSTSNVGIGVSSTNLVAQVTGVAATTITWKVKYEILK